MALITAGLIAAELIAEPMRAVVGALALPRWALPQ
jgi:hypothetical protein